MVDDRHAVAEPLGLFHVVRREENRAAGGLVGGDPLPELEAALRIQARRRLVEKQDLGVAGQRAGDGEPLPLAARELADARVALLLEREIRQQLLRRPAPRS